MRMPVRSVWSLPDDCWGHKTRGEFLLWCDMEDYARSDDGIRYQCNKIPLERDTNEIRYHADGQYRLVRVGSQVLAELPEWESLPRQTGTRDKNRIKILNPMLGMIPLSLLSQWRSHETFFYYYKVPSPRRPPKLVNNNKNYADCADRAEVRAKRTSEPSPRGSPELINNSNNQADRAEVRAKRNSEVIK